MALNLTASNKETGDFIVLDEDTYDAAYQKYEEYAGEFGPALKLFFTVAYADDKGKTQYTEVSGIAGISQAGALGLKSKLRIWIEALMGRALADGEAIDLEALANSPCRLILSIKKGKTRDDGTQAQFNRIEKVLAPRKRATKPAAAADDLV